VKNVDELTIIALAPFYAAAVYSVWWGMVYGMHMLRRIDQSATETKLTETIPRGSTTSANTAAK